MAPTNPPPVSKPSRRVAGFAPRVQSRVSGGVERNSHRKCNIPVGTSVTILMNPARLAGGPPGVRFIRAATSISIPTGPIFWVRMTE
jgi:hypothetical protein